MLWHGNGDKDNRKLLSDNQNPANNNFNCKSRNKIVQDKDIALTIGAVS